jgi:hypothetical protein
MKNRINGQGYHPKARIYVPKVKVGGRIKRILLVLPATKWLAIIRRGGDLVATRCNHLESGIWTVNNEVLLEPIVEEVRCVDSGTWYVDTNGCGMLQINEANPPPKRGFSYKALHYAASVLVFALMALLGACKPDPMPTPEPNPNDTVQPVVPTKEITLYWDWEANVGWAPSTDTIKYYTDQDSVKWVTIHLIGCNGVGFPINCSSFHPGTFHRARNELQPCINVDSTRVKLGGSLYTKNVNLPTHDDEESFGMASYDREWYERKGCTVLVPNHSK